MSHVFRRFFTLTTMVVLASSVDAQTTYKCGNGYSQTPCADGKIIATDDARTDEQKRQADASTTRNQAAAKALEKERIAQEKKDALALKKANADGTVAKPKSAATKVYKQKTVKPLKPLKVLKKKKTTPEKP
jgi:hypothetical protein